MKKSLLIVMPVFLLLFTATTCDEDQPLICDDRLESLSELGNRIEALAAASECGDAFECRFIGFGSKPCGGPWSYLIYSTSIDTLQLQNLVSDYNNIENDYNMTCDAVSDCSLPNQPIGFECQDNNCIPQFL